MTAFTGILLAMMTVFNAKIGRSYVYPPAIYTAVWSFLLLGLALCGGMFYPLSCQSLTVFLAGGLIFSLGGFAGILIGRNYPLICAATKPPDNSSFIDKVLKYSLIAQIVIAPLYFNQLREISVFSDANDFFIGIRLITSTGDKPEMGLGIFAYIIAAMSFLTMAAFAENIASFKLRARAVILLIITITYHLLSGARTGAISLLFALFFISMIKSRRFPVKPALYALLFFLIIFAVPAVLLRKGGNIEDAFMVNAGNIMGNLRDYIFPGIVAFDINITNGTPVDMYGAFRSLLAIVNMFGAGFNLPNSLLPYVYTPVETNLYTMYYYYFGLGWWFFTAVMLVLGIISALLYRSALTGSRRGIVLCALFSSCLMLSGQGDNFLTILSYWIQAAVFFTVLYRWPQIKAAQTEPVIYAK